MLHIETVEPSTFRLLEELMAIKELQPFSLVGGTALSLQLGHRKSDHIDLFCTQNFDKRIIIELLKKNFDNRFELRSRETNPLGVFGFIDDIKVDICKHTFPLIDNLLIADGIRMWSLPDIAASKVHAISMRAKKKDFWDIARLLDLFTLTEIASFYRCKYEPMLAIGVAHIITFFGDAEDSIAPLCLMKKNWEIIKREIAQKINEQTK